MQPTRALPEWLHNEQKCPGNPGQQEHSMCPCVRKDCIAAKIKLDDHERILLFPALVSEKLKYLAMDSEAAL